MDVFTLYRPLGKCRICPSPANLEFTITGESAVYFLQRYGPPTLGERQNPGKFLKPPERIGRIWLSRDCITRLGKRSNSEYVYKNPQK